MSKSARKNLGPYKSPKRFLKEKRDLQSAYQLEFQSPSKKFLTLRDQPYPEKVWKNIKYNYDPDLIQSSAQVTYKGHKQQEMTKSFAKQFRNANLSEYDYNRTKLLETQNLAKSIFQSDYQAYNKDSFRKKTVYPENIHKISNIRYEPDTIKSQYTKEYQKYNIEIDRPKTAQSLYEPKSFQNPFTSQQAQLEKQKSQIEKQLVTQAKQNKPAYMRQIIKARYPSEVIKSNYSPVHRVETFGSGQTEADHNVKWNRQFNCNSEYQTNFQKFNTEPAKYTPYHLQYKSIDAPFTCKSSYNEQFKNYGKVERTKKIIFNVDDDSD